MPKFSLSALPRPAKYISFFIAILLALLAILGVGVTYAYRGKYYPGLKVDGIAIGGMEKSAADAKVEAFTKTVADRKVSVAVPDITQPQNEDTGLYPETHIDANASDVGLTVSSQASLDAAWAKGHGNGGWTWITQVSHLFFDGGYSFSAEPAVDEEKTKAFVVTQVAAHASAPQPAKVVIDGKDVTVQKETPGLAIDADALTAQISSALHTSLDGDALSFRIAPTLTDSAITQASIQPIADQLNAIGNTKVSLTADGVNLKPTRDQLLQWYSPVQDDSGKISLGISNDKIATYLQQNGKSLDQKKSLASVTTAATTWLTAPVAAATVAVTLKPAAQVTVGSYQAGLFDGKYIYVNLAEQKAYRMNGTTLEKVYQVSTGKWSTPTPRGTFHVASKVPRAYSREFGLYMPWWQNFLGTADDGSELPTGSYGLHELPEWPNGYKEGEGHLGTPVSHGCVRFGVGDAKEVYDWTEIGTPVVIE